MYETSHHVGNEHHDRNVPPCSKTSTAMTLSAADEDYRIGKFTGSLANTVMTAKSEAEWVKAWLVKTGQEPPGPCGFGCASGSASAGRQANTAAMTTTGRVFVTAVISLLQ